MLPTRVDTVAGKLTQAGVQPLWNPAEKPRVQRFSPSKRYHHPMTSEELQTQGLRTIVVPAAGLGTRFLPATKTVPKELLPVVETPGIELIAREAILAGAERLAIITAENKQGVMEHFAQNKELEATLQARGNTQQLRRVQGVHGRIQAISVIQEQPLGLGHAIGLAESVLGEDEECFGVMLPDDLVLPFGVMEKMLRVREEFGGCVLCAFEVPRAEVSQYGVFEVQECGAEGAWSVKSMVEKPDVQDAPSNYVAAGRYVLDREVFSALRNIKPGKGGEIHITDAIEFLIEQGHPVHVVVHRGIRHDLGNPGGYIRACVDFALRDDAYGSSLRSWLDERLTQPDDKALVSGVELSR